MKQRRPRSRPTQPRLAGAADGDRETLLQGVEAQRPPEGLGKIGDVLEHAVTSGFSRPALEAARTLLATLERECEKGRLVPLDALTTASVHCIRIAGATLDGSWVDAVFRIHRARASVLPVEVVDALYILLRRVKVDLVTYREYVETMAECRAELTPAERFALRRTEGLASLLRR